MTEKIEHKKTGIIKINGGYQVVWKFNNQLFHIGFIGELDEIERYKVLFDNAMTMLLAEKDECIKNFLTALEFQKIDDFMNKATPTDYLNLGASFNETINDKLSEKDAEIERLKEQLRLCEQQETIKRNIGIEVQNDTIPN